MMKQVKQQLMSMGFQQDYIVRAFKLHKKHFGNRYHFDVLSEIIVRLQNKDKAKIKKSIRQIEIPISIPIFNSADPFFPSHMTMEDALKLNTNDKIDHRDNTGRFVHATILKKEGTNLKIHYDGWAHKWDVWSDFIQELHRFAFAKSISERPEHRFQLEIGDSIDINPIHKHKGWRRGTVRRLDQKSGQIQVAYDGLDFNYLYWVHIDNTAEIAEFGTKSVNKSDITVITHQIQKLNWQLTNIFKTNAIYSCFAQEIYGDLSKISDIQKKYTDYVKSNMNKLYFETINSNKSIFTALSELYNVRIRIIEYECRKKTLSAQKFGEYSQTAHLPLIVLAKIDSKQYGVVFDPNSIHQRPLNMHRVVPTIKRQLSHGSDSSDTQPSQKRIKLSQIRINGTTFYDCVKKGDQLQDWTDLKVTVSRFVYTQSQKLLICGECDFSLTASMILKIGGNGSNICSTAWYYKNNWIECVLKSIGGVGKAFSTFTENLTFCENNKANIAFGIDARSLQTTQHKWNKLTFANNGFLFDRVLFTFPRTFNPQWTKTRYNKENQMLLFEILGSAKGYLAPNGEIQIMFLKKQFLYFQIKKVLNCLGLEIAYWCELNKESLNRYFPLYTPRDCLGNMMDTSITLDFHFCSFKVKQNRIW